jgi:protein SCO1/2
MILVMLSMLLYPVAAQAADHLHGVVLSVTPATGEAIVRHDPFGGMPSMTMPFRITPKSEAADLQAGSIIDATVDRSTDPWTLSHIASSSAQGLTAQPVLRRVTPLRVGDLVPDVPFIDQRGKPFVMSSLRGEDVILSFIYTRCQDPRMCPLISAQFGRIQSLIGKRDLHLVEVTLDPTYDRPPVLARYGTLFGADPKHWTLAVGDAGQTLDFAAKFGITAFPDPSIGIIHSEDTVIIDKTGRIIEEITENSWSPDEILAQIDAQNGENANPVMRLDLWLSREAVAMCGNSVAGFSGLTDLVIVAIIIAAGAYAFYRLARAFRNAT